MVRELCEMIPDVSKTCTDNILTDRLGYAKVCARWVPRMLTEDHKRQRVEVAHEFLQAYETDGDEFLDSIVTADETWVHYTAPETKQQSRQRKHLKSPKPRKFKQTLSAGKVMASVFWDRKVLLLCEIMPAGTINANRYCETLKNLHCAIQNKRRGMLTKGVLEL
jgi:histone-lysine N-methyltransferase SETMAR